MLDVGSVPVGAGGFPVHSYGFITALTWKLGPKQCSILYADAHDDTCLLGYGRAVHEGSLFGVAVDLGSTEGRDLVQVGLHVRG